MPRFVGLRYANPTYETPDRHHHLFLATAPVLRLFIIIVAFTLIVPRVIEPTFENMVALMGALEVIQEMPWGTHYRVRAYPIHPGQKFQFINELTVRGKAVLTELAWNSPRFPQRRRSREFGAR